MHGLGIYEYIMTTVDQPALHKFTLHLTTLDAQLGDHLAEIGAVRGVVGNGSTATLVSHSWCVIVGVLLGHHLESKALPCHMLERFLKPNLIAVFLHPSAPGFRMSEQLRTFFAIRSFAEIPMSCSATSLNAVIQKDPA